ncbi:prephenate dehydratase [Leptolyngbya sp. PCC 6406]|uniref:prephenate dehydratase n=1 Tax=Leptolyngbya sp. PCC 6406 TaxID=1173264 RepID=UPI0002AC5084|nr:prephenate dehydratase [Leptolyngbya sp. PCC 6406]
MERVLELEASAKPAGGMVRKLNPIHRYSGATMALSLAFLGPQGTYSEQAALAYSQRLRNGPFGPVSDHRGESGVELKAFPSILQAIQAVFTEETDLAIVPVENSIEGSVAVTLDALWQWPTLRIQEALVLPIANTLITHATNLAAVKTLYSHPQPLGQCQQWIKTHCPQAVLVPTRSTAEALGYLAEDRTAAAIASQRAAQIYDLPILAWEINDQVDNCTKFLILGHHASDQGTYTSLAFSLSANEPGALLKPLQLLADAPINLSRIESRPTKRSLGEYLFFLELEAPVASPVTQVALAQLQHCTETLRVFGSYDVLPI